MQAREGPTGDDALIAELATAAAGPGSSRACGDSATLAAGAGGEARTGEPGDPVALARGSVVGRYQVMGLLGSGGMGVVYTAHDPELDRKVALKVLRGGGGPADTLRLLREARALAKLAHPNIVAVHDAGTIAGGDTEVFLAMEFVAGVTLRAWLDERPRSVGELLSVFIAAGRGLAAAHRAGLVHRDFKPDNVMVGNDGRTRVMDFGLARTLTEAPSQVGGGALAGDLRLTREGSLLGTPAYMAPEQWQGGTVDARSDQFSFCVALWEALYGARPFRGGSLVELMSAVTEGAIQRPAEPRRRVPGWIEAVLGRGLARASGQRFESMDALLAAIEGGLTRQRRRPIFVGIAAAGALVAGLFGVRAQREAACAAEGAEIHSVWNVQTRESLHDALRATGLSYAESSFERAVPYLDAWAESWAAARAEVCRGSNEGVRSPELTTKAAACLDEQREGFAALIEAIIDQSDEHVARMVPAVSELPQVALCTEQRALERRPEPPADKAVRAEATKLRRALLRARGRMALGDCTARGEAEALRGRAEALGVAPLVVTAGALVADLALCAGDRKAAEAALRGVYVEAEALGMDEMVATAAIDLISAIGDDRGRAAEALQWALPAETAVRRLGQADGLAGADLLQSKALVLRGQGDLGEAQAAMETALTIREAVLGPEHPKIASTLLVLGRIHRSRNALDAALAVQTRAQDIRKAALGPQHPALATGANDLGLLEQSRGRYAEAKVYFVIALDIAEAAYGPDHREVATILNNLGRLQHLRGEYAEGRQLLARALKIREAQLGAEDLDVAATLHNLGLLELAEGERVAARKVLTRVLKIRERKLEADHPELVTILNDLGTVLYRVGEYAEALEHHQRALEIQRRRGSPDREVAMTMRSVALVRHALGEAEAFTLAREALDLGEQAVGEDHPDVATLLNAYGLVARRRDPAGAQAALERALAISVRARGKKHLATATSLVRLGEVYADRGEYALAQASLDEALAIREATREDSPEVAEVLVTLGQVAASQGRVAEGVAALERALEIRGQPGIPQRELAEARFALARALPADQRARGEALARQAAEGLRGEERAAVDQWLRGR